jgi:hypothetical protein
MRRRSSRSNSARSPRMRSHDASPGSWMIVSSVRQRVAEHAGEPEHVLVADCGGLDIHAAVQPLLNDLFLG